MTNWDHSVISNDEENRKFANSLGYAILNCGVIEQLTYTYASTLTDKHLFGTGQGRKLFSDRKRHVINLLRKADIDGDVRKRAIALWDDSTKVMRARNVIAHNPIVRVDIDRADGPPESMMAVVDMARSQPQEVQHLEITKIGNVANRAMIIVDGLFECHAAIQRSLSK